MDETLVFIDEGFLDKLTILFGEGKRIKFDKLSFAVNIAKKQNFFLRHLFYYTAPPFQSAKPILDEINRKRGYDSFVKSLGKYKEVTIREGRCQRIISLDNRIDYNKKGVDTLLTIDLSHIKEDFPNIKKIILVSSDTDFCPIIRDIKLRQGIEVILYSYTDRKRNSRFSISNELLSCCSRFIQLTKKDFEEARFEKDSNL